MASALSAARNCRPPARCRLSRADAEGQSFRRCRPLTRDARRAPSWRIDAATRRNLELTETLSGERARQPAVACIDRTVTAAVRASWRRGWPRRLTDAAAIARAHDAVAFFADDRELRERVARRSAPRARHRARAGAALGRARRPARSRRHLRDGIKAARALARQLRLDDPLEPRRGEARDASSSTDRRSRRRLAPVRSARTASGRRAALSCPRRRLHRGRRACAARRGAQRCATNPAASSPASKRAIATTAACRSCASSTTACSAISSK